MDARQERRRSDGNGSHAGADALRLADLIRHANNGIYQCTDEGEFLAVNPALVRMLGYDCERDLRRTHLTDHYASVRDALVVDRRLRDQECVEGLELTFKGKDGPLVEAILNARAVRDPQGNLV